MTVKEVIKNNVFYGFTAVSGVVIIVDGVARLSHYVIRLIRIIPGPQLLTSAFFTAGMVTFAATADFLVRYSLNEIFIIRDKAFANMASTLAGLAFSASGAFFLYSHHIIPLSFSSITILIGMGLTAFVIYKLFSMPSPAVHPVPQKMNNQILIPKEEIVRKTFLFKEIMTENPFNLITTLLKEFVRSLLPIQDKKQVDEIFLILAPLESEFNQLKIVQNIVKVLKWIDEDLFLSIIPISILNCNEQQGRWLWQNAQNYLEIERQKVNVLHDLESAPLKTNFIQKWIQIRLDSIQKQHKECSSSFIQQAVNHKNEINCGLWLTKSFLKLFNIVNLGEKALHFSCNSALKAARYFRYISNDTYKMIAPYTSAIVKLFIYLGPQLQKNHDWQFYVKHFESIENIIKNPLPPNQREIRKLEIEFFGKMIEELQTNNYTAAFDDALQSVKTLID